MKERWSRKRKQNEDRTREKLRNLTKNECFTNAKIAEVGFSFSFSSVLGFLLHLDFKQVRSQFALRWTMEHRPQRRWWWYGALAVNYGWTSDEGESKYSSHEIDLSVTGLTLIDEQLSSGTSTGFQATAVLICFAWRAQTIAEVRWKCNYSSLKNLTSNWTVILPEFEKISKKKWREFETHCSLAQAAGSTVAGVLLTYWWITHGAIPVDRCVRAAFLGCDATTQITSHLRPGAILDHLCHS